jgi:hypothetical protein
VKRIITKTTTKEHDTILLQNLLLDFIKKQQNLRDIANIDTHGQSIGLKVRGQVEYNEYKKAKKNYDFNYSKVEKKYLDVFSLIASVMSKCQKYLNKIVGVSKIDNIKQRLYINMNLYKLLCSEDEDGGFYFNTFIYPERNKFIDEIKKEINQDINLLLRKN